MHYLRNYRGKCSRHYQNNLMRLTTCTFSLTLSNKYLPWYLILFLPFLFSLKALLLQSSLPLLIFSLFFSSASLLLASCLAFFSCFSNGFLSRSSVFLFFSASPLLPFSSHSFFLFLFLFLFLPFSLNICIDSSLVRTLADSVRIGRCLLKVLKMR